ADAGYDADRLLFNPLFDGVHPQGIARCGSAADVAACLAFTEAHGVPFAVRGGGHSFGGYSTSTGLVIDLTPMSQVAVGPGSTAQIGAGARLIDVYAGLADHGVMIPAGSCPTVGIAGLTLGGGVGVVSRKYGLTIDNLQAAEVVLADGRTVTCDDRHEPDLFWALRGGGAGSFGVVTSFTFRTRPAPSLALGGLHWPWSAAGAVLSAWLDWAPTAPDELWSNALLLAQDTVPSGHGKEGGEPTVRVGAVYVGSSGGLASLLDDLVRRVGHAPISRTGHTAGYLDAMRYEGGCSDRSIAQCRLPSQGPAGQLAREASVARAEYLGAKLPDAGIQVIVDAVTRRQADPGLSGGGAAFDAYGGAINRVPPTATAFVHRNPRCGVLLNGTLPAGSEQSVVDANAAWVDGLGMALKPYVDGEAYQNYVDPRRPDWAQAYYGANLARLREVKRRYDPHNRFHFAQSIPR
ncbi:MAG TPA: FAD-binding oxidoreductase, partial [Acidimicrobiales bacterium]